MRPITLKTWTVASLVVALAAPVETFGEPPATSPIKACVETTEAIVEMINRSEFDGVSSLFADASDAESARLSIWLRIMIREFGYPEERSLVAPDQVSKVYDEFEGITFSTLSFKQFRAVPDVIEMAYTVHFSHEREGMVGIELVETGESCSAVLIGLALPSTRPDVFKRLGEIGSQLSTEIGEGLMVH